MISMIKTNWDLALFFSRPISAILGGITIVVWLFPLLMSFLQRKSEKSL
jgi:TctA family transporter